MGLDRLVAERGSALLASAVLLTGSRAAGEDLLQAALERLMRSWGRVREDHERYLRRTMYHLAIDQWRRRRRRPEVFVDYEHPDGPDASDAVDLRDALDRALAQLAPRQRAVLVLRYCYRSDVYLPDDDPTPAGSDGQIKAPPAPDPHAVSGPLHLSQSHSGSGPLGNRESVTVDYDRRTWSTEHDTEVPPPSTVPNVTDPQSVEAAITNGTFEVIGKDAVNGVPALHLRISTTTRGYRIDLWVDRSTFLPLQQTQTVTSENPARPAVTTTYAWLPRTAENLARLVLTGPPGFTRQP
jgi:RNA polymerase sigma factor (sigma-70 family)